MVMTRHRLGRHSLVSKRYPASLLHIASRRFRNGPRDMNKVMMDSNIYRRRLRRHSRSQVLPRRSCNTVVEAPSSFHDGLQRPSWKPGASTTVSI
ncbi:hypothetical protein TIFTF001_030880 [Ficus carica]|uniref:Uncharacterized protein n=1 Tax=Ficus carica TaxID=3494 RepID=A0AA88DUB6_FICCA|nr:hypothetical protein TIFTF001_030880 [Ficus carica]